jgi:hypothetical protein
MNFNSSSSSTPHLYIKKKPRRKMYLHSNMVAPTTFATIMECVTTTLFQQHSFQQQSFQQWSLQQALIV